MKQKLALLATILLALTGSVHRVAAQGTAFTYQGRLSENGGAASGAYEFRFTLHDMVGNGAQIGNAVTNCGVTVNAGTFTVMLNFGAGTFPGANRWLQLGVRTNGSTGAFTALNPRQALTAAPYAVTAGEVTSANIARLDVPNTAMQATGTPTVSFGFVVNATVTGGGSGYAIPPTVTVNDPTGSGAVITASISGGAVVGLAVQNTGGGYSSGATLIIAPPPSNAYQTFSGVNYFSGVNTMNNANNTFAGSFSGNGANLTNIPGLLTWQIVSGTNQQALPNTGYIVTNSDQATISLPAAPKVGTSVRVVAPGMGSWKIAQNSGQAILAGNSAYSVKSIGVNWSPRDTNRFWWSVASSADGTKLVAAVNGGQIYTSSDSGLNWTPHQSANAWNSVASSSDGTKLVAVVNNGPIYTSGDSGVTWSPHQSRAWNSVASSSDGRNLVAVVYGGQIYTSTDSGLSWTPRETSRSWNSVASSSDGTKLVAVVNGGQIYTSTDFGINWTPRESSRTWFSVTSSSDGTKLVAVVNAGQIYTSVDSGLNWIPRESERYWTSVASSADGTKLSAVVETGYIFTSTDSGINWTARESPRKWFSVASSADGTKLVALAQFGQIYVSVPVIAPSTATTIGTAGYLTGESGAAIELMYIGSGQFMPLSHEGTILAY